MTNSRRVKDAPDASAVPRGRKCSPARTRIIETYKAAMREAEPGYGADVTLAPDEDKRLVLRWLRRSSGLNTRVDERRSHQNGVGRDATCCSQIVADVSEVAG